MSIPAVHNRTGSVVGRQRQYLRIAPGLLGMAALVGGLLTALARLGWGLGGAIDGISLYHGALMVGGFLGSVIGLERAVAAGGRRAYVAPALSALGAVLLVGPFPEWSGRAALTLSAFALVAVFVAFLRVQWSDFTGTMAAGAVAWAVGNLFWWLDFPLAQVVPWWAAFLILTIAGERLEMSRLRPRQPSALQLFYVLIALYTLGSILTITRFDTGMRLIGLALMGLTLWLLRHDVAWVTIRNPGLPRYAASAILSGYFWLLCAGLLATARGGTWSGLEYDALVHAQFLGFVFGMIMAHAPIILPAIAGLPVHFSPLFYLPLALLHTSLLLRVGADLVGWLPGRLWGGTLNVAAVVVFLVVVLHAVVRGGLWARRAPVSGPPA